MCVSAAVVAGVTLAATAVSTVAAIDNANYQASMAELQAQEQLKALQDQRKDAELQGLEAQLARTQEFEERRAANLAAMAANTGFGTNMGFFQGVREAEEEALRYDLTNIRLGVLGENNRVNASERSIGYGQAISRSNRKSAVFGSLLNFASGAVGAAQIYRNYNV